jgi:hypothetical protein
MRAEEPAGADTLIVLATDRRLVALELALSAIDGKRKPSELADAIAAHLGPKDRLGLASYTTRPRR